MTLSINVSDTIIMGKVIVEEVRPHTPVLSPYFVVFKDVVITTDNMTRGPARALLNVFSDCHNR